MKCTQQLCQRTKNLCKNGNCSICDDVLKHATEYHKQIDKRKSVKTVQVDMKKMIDIHGKLSKGANIDTKDVNVLVLGGIINIISQHDALQDLEDRIKVAEHNDVTNRTRIESLDNWVGSQVEVIKELSEKLATMDQNGVIVKESNQIKALRERIVDLEIDKRTVSSVSTAKNSKTIDINVKESGNRKQKSTKCEECGREFSRNCDLENHLEDHEKEKSYECDQCGKSFFLEWRLKKHENVHKGDAKHCHYFNNGKPCPFFSIGCMFLHEKSGKCKFPVCKNSMCQFEHLEIDLGDSINDNEAQSINNQNEDMNVEIVEEVNNPNDESSNHETASGKIDEIDTIEEYECHLCNSIHPSQVSREECCDHQYCSFLECHSHPAFFKLS